MHMFSDISDAAVVAALRAGQVGVLPTDTVYGVVASAHDPAAVARLYALKHREHKPGTLIAADAEQLRQLGLDADQLGMAEQFWPGPVSIIMDAPALEYLHQGIGSLAARVPADEKLRALLHQTGPLLTSSANQPGESPATNVAEAQRYFGEGADFYVDGGDLAGRTPSTIIKVEDGTVRVVRAGAVDIKTKEK